MSNESKARETSSPEMPPDFDPVGTLLDMARAFLPSFELASPTAQPYTEPVGSTADRRFLRSRSALPGTP